MECSFSMVCIIYYAFSRFVNVVRNILVASRLGSCFATKRPAARHSLLCQATGTWQTNLRTRQLTGPQTVRLFLIESQIVDGDNGFT